MEDLIHFNYPYPSKRKKMSMINRGAQFSPFAALTGYEDAIDEEKRLTEEKILLSEEEIAIINQKLNLLEEHKKEEVHVALTYFVKDLKKAGGSYQTYFGTIKKIIPSEQKLITSSCITISFDDLFDIQSNLFTNLE